MKAEEILSIEESAENRIVCTIYSILGFGLPSPVKIGMKYNEVVELMGKPTDSVGSGLVWYRYKIGEGWYIKLFFSSSYNTLVDMRIVDYPNDREFRLKQNK
jgi:hypothetical protein